MAVTYSTAVKNARLDVVTTQALTAAVLEIGTAGMALVLATIPLANPIAAAAASGVLTLTMPRSDTAADASGTAAAARLRTGGALDIITGLTVGLTGSNINLDNLSINVGQTVTISSATLTHG
jgi:hypothetical protein